MAQPAIQTSFHAGEWAAALNARVDLAKYHSAAALLLNWFVDYRGGASTRPGTKYVLQAYKSATAVRLIPFQASFTVGYALEFGDQYIRFHYAGAPVLEATKAITGASQANPCNLTIVGHNYSVGEWIYVTGAGGMTQLNGRYFIVRSVVGVNNITLNDLYGAAVNSAAYTAYTAGGTAARVYTVASPYAAADLAKLKFAQNVDKLYLCHPSYAPYVLTIITAANWTLIPITFGSTVSAPTGMGAATSLGAGTVNYSYVTTAIDLNGQESSPSAAASLANKLDLRTIAGTNTISWTAVSGAISYNVYKAEPAYAAVPAGAAYGFIGNCTGVSFNDSNIASDFSLTPPVAENPFQGSPVASFIVTAPGAYTTVPGVTVAAAPAGGQTATATATLQVQSAVVAFSGDGYTVGQICAFIDGITMVVATIDGSGGVLTFQPFTFPGSNRGAVSSGNTPANNLVSTTPGASVNVQITATWGVGIVTPVSGGAGYTSVPAVTFSAGAAAATAVLGPASAGNPAAVTLFQQRLVLAAPAAALQTFYMSQPGSPYNFNISNPIQADDSITESLSAGQLNEIKSMVGMPSGLILFTNRAVWQVNGGSAGSAISATDVTGNPHSQVGAGDVPPIVSNFDILFVQAKGSVVRDVTYNFYANIFTGTDISVLSSHLFYGYTITEWAWAEEPFKVVWAIRSDGTLLALTFLKEQELIGWTHSTTTGSWKSVATITETVSFGAVDAVYLVAQRTINGQTLKYIERMAERIFTNGAADAWCVDAGLQYSGVPATNFSGGDHLIGQTVTGLADGVVITPFVMPASGSFVLPAASKVTIGLGYICDLQTLPLDLGEPTVQGKRKKITGVTVRCQDTLGLQIGRAAGGLVNMKDLVIGNVGSMTNTVVAGLVTGDARTNIDPLWDVPGQYLIRQANPLPATVLGVIPEIAVGDTK